jgi:CheY-like chemotaxis protein
MSSKKILIVDDNPVVLKALSIKLTANGYEVVTAKDGSEAVSAVRRVHPNLILLDISFPPDVGHGGGVAWDGFLIMSWMKRIEEAKTTPFIVISAGDPVEFKERALAAGAMNYFQKPVDNEELFTAIRHALDEDAESEPMV